MRWFQGLLLSVTLLASPPLWTQSNPSPQDRKQEVVTLLDKMAKASGGWAKVRSVRAIRVKSTVQRPDKTYQSDELLLPDRLRREDNFFGFARTLIVSPQVGVFFAAGHADSQLEPSEKESWSSKFRFNLIFLLQRPANSAYEFSALGQEKLGKAETKILEVKGYGFRQRLYVDSLTNRVVRAVWYGAGGGVRTVDFSDWATAGGLTLPLTVKWNDGKTVGEERIMAIEFNPPVDHRLFGRNGIALADLPFHPAPLLPAPGPSHSP